MCGEDSVVMQTTTYIHTYLHTGCDEDNFIHTYIHTYIHIYIHTGCDEDNSIHTYIHTYMEGGHLPNKVDR